MHVPHEVKFFYLDAPKEAPRTITKRGVDPPRFRNLYGARKYAESTAKESKRPVRLIIADGKSGKPKLQANRRWAWRV